MPIPSSEYNRPWYGAQCCRLLEAATADDAGGQCAAAWSGNGWGPADLKVWESQNLLPAVVAGMNDKQLFAGISGTDRIQQFLHYADPVKVYHAVNPNKALNSAFWNWGATVANKIQEADTTRKRVIHLAGHSYGGAVATAAAWNLLEDGWKGPIFLTTFGAPKLGSDDATPPAPNIFHVHWINQNDPIPALPPSEGEIGFPLKLTWRLGIKVILPPYDFLPPGLKLFPSGSFVNGTPDNLTPTIPQLLAGFDDWDTAAFQPYAHRLKEYRRRLELWEAPQPPASAGIADLADWLRWTNRWRPPTTPAIPKIDAVNAARIKQQQALKYTPNYVLVSFPYGDESLFSGGHTMPYVPSPYLAKKQKYGTKWSLMWKDQRLAIGTRTECLSLQKVLNHFLRRVQVMEGFSQDGFERALNFYITDAVEGGLGFKPDQLQIIP